jgi:hypothetical protein
MKQVWQFALLAFEPGYCKYCTVKDKGDTCNIALQSTTEHVHLQYNNAK